MRRRFSREKEGEKEREVKGEMEGEKEGEKEGEGVEGDLEEKWRRMEKKEGIRLERRR